MPYRFKPGQSVPENVRRIVNEEVDAAVAQLSRQGTGRWRDDAIHEARKSVKKIRAVLRLIRGELGSAYAEENASLRDIGRQLSELRDAGAIVETLDGIRESHGSEIESSALAAIRRGLQRNKRERERKLNVTVIMRRAATALRACKRRVARWPLSEDEFAAIEPGLRASYKAGRRAMDRAGTSQLSEDLHEWRKRVKDHWYHVRLLEELWTGMMDAREQGLHDLETWLGDGHNLVVLEELLQADPERYGGAEAVGVFATIAKERRNGLRAKSLALGHRLYERKPRQSVADLRKIWRLWRKEPREVREGVKVAARAAHSY